MDGCGSSNGRSWGMADNTAHAGIQESDRKHPVRPYFQTADSSAVFHSFLRSSARFIRGLPPDPLRQTEEESDGLSCVLRILDTIAL